MIERLPLPLLYEELNEELRTDLRLLAESCWGSTAAAEELRQRQARRRTSAATQSKKKHGAYEVVAAELEPLYRRHPRWPDYRYAREIAPKVNAQLKNPLGLAGILYHVRNFLRTCRGD
jgi:hypothetical protein